MGTHKSADKRHRQSLTRRARNQETILALRKAVKAVRTAISAGEKDKAEEAFKVAQKLMAKAGNKRVLHRKNASRRIGRLAKAVSAKKTN